MIITFCGHSKFELDYNLEEQVFNEIEKFAKGEPVIFYLGGYGRFDEISKHAAKRYKNKNNNSVLTFVTPYMDEKYLKNREPLKDGYDNIYFPDIENTPKKYALLERNKCMVKEADYIIAFVKFSWGGAAKMLEYAQKHNKKFINLATQQLD